jgi:CTP:molybdopterin cytidylyltransferase MocA
MAKNIASAEKHGVEALAPVCGGRKGHPIVLSPKLAPLIAALDPAKDRLDFWLRTRKEKTVDAPFLCIHENWNEVGKG